MPTETVYKLVSRVGDTLESWHTGPTEWRVEYPVGVVVQPKQQGSLLFAFSELGAAAYWHRRENDTEIWEAEAEDPILILDVADSFSPFRMVSYWFWWFNWRLPLDNIVRAPICTVGCKSVKLVRRIDTEELKRTA